MTFYLEWKGTAKVGWLNKSSCFAAALGVTKLITFVTVNLVIFRCAALVQFNVNKFDFEVATFSNVGFVEQKLVFSSSFSVTEFTSIGNVILITLFVPPSGT